MAGRDDPDPEAELAGGGPHKKISQVPVCEFDFFKNLPKNFHGVRQGEGSSEEAHSAKEDVEPGNREDREGRETEKENRETMAASTHKEESAARKETSNNKEGNHGASAAMAAQKKNLNFPTDLHSRYLKKFLTDKTETLDYFFTVHLRSGGAYWGVTALDLLNQFGELGFFFFFLMIYSVLSVFPAVDVCVHIQTESHTEKQKECGCVSSAGSRFAGRCQ